MEEEQKKMEEQCKLLEKELAEMKMKNQMEMEKSKSEQDKKGRKLEV